MSVGFNPSPRDCLDAAGSIERPDRRDRENMDRLPPHDATPAGGARKAPQMQPIETGRLFATVAVAAGRFVTGRYARMTFCAPRHRGGRACPDERSRASADSPHAVLSR